MSLKGFGRNLGEGYPNCGAAALNAFGGTKSSRTIELDPESSEPGDAAVSDFVDGLLGRRNNTSLLGDKRRQRHLGIGTVLGCRLLQPLDSFTLIPRQSVTVAIAQPEIILGCRVAFTSRLRDPLRSDWAPLWDPASDL